MLYQLCSSDLYYFDSEYFNIIVHCMSLSYWLQLVVQQHISCLHRSRFSVLDWGLFRIQLYAAFVSSISNASSISIYRLISAFYILNNQTYQNAQTIMGYTIYYIPLTFMNCHKSERVLSQNSPFVFSQFIGHLRSPVFFRPVTIGLI